MKKIIISASDATKTACFIAEYINDFGDTWDEKETKIALMRVVEALALADKIEIVPDGMMKTENAA